jgi:hypothetical protein
MKIALCSENLVLGSENILSSLESLAITYAIIINKTQPIRYATINKKKLENHS